MENTEQIKIILDYCIDNTSNLGVFYILADLKRKIKKLTKSEIQWILDLEKEYKNFLTLNKKTL